MTASTDQMTLLNTNGGSTDNVICAIGENREHNIWVTNERSLARITVSKEKMERGATLLRHTAVLTDCRIAFSISGQ